MSDCSYLPAGEDAVPIDQPSREMEILFRRAERLARRDAPRSTTDNLQFLVFELGAERFALELQEVCAVVPIQRYTRVPGTPPELLGVTHIRGELLPLLDLGKVFGLLTQEGALGYAVVCPRSLTLALRVDRVQDVVRVPVAAVQSPEPAGSLSGLLSGVLPDGTAVIRLDALHQHPALGNAARA